MNQNLEISPEQRDLLLEGLRYVRSSRKLAFRDAVSPADPKWADDLKVVTELMGILEPNTTAPRSPK